MSDKHGSAREERDPDTPDTLTERLRVQRDRRAQSRANASSQEPKSNTPASAVQVSKGQEAGAESARSSLRFDDNMTTDRQQPPPPPGGVKQAWHGLYDLKHEDMLEWMAAQGADESFMIMVHEMKLDGPMWRAAVTDPSSTQLRPDLESMVKGWGSGSSSPPAAVMKITMGSKLALEEWVKHGKGVKLSQFSLKELQTIKLPELPVGKGVDGRIIAEQLKGYCESLHSTLNIVDKEYSSRIYAIHIAPTIETLKICFQGMTSRAWQLDELIGSSLMKKSQDKTIATIIAMKRNMYEGSYSGLCIIQMMGESTSQLTGARLGDLLIKLFNPLQDPPTELAKLEPTYKIHKEALNSLISLDIELHPVIQCFILQQMASKLAMKSEYNLILGIPMASIIKNGFEDLDGMTSIMESAIVQASNDPKANKPRVKSDLEKKLERAHRQIAALQPAKTEDRICVTHREQEVLGYVCIKGSDCKFKHGLAEGSEVHSVQHRPWWQAKLQAGTDKNGPRFRKPGRIPRAA